jgi:hypothetical protein
MTVRTGLAETTKHSSVTLLQFHICTLFLNNRYLTFASKVLPQPGGPASNIPWDLDKPRSLKASGCLTGA